MSVVSKNRNRWLVLAAAACISCGSSTGSGAGATGDGAHDDWLVPQNQARADVGEAALAWDPIAAAVAMSWASQCPPFGHNPNASSEYGMMGGNQGGLGENAAAGAPTETVAGAVASWINEKANYDYASNSCTGGQECGHYTQVVWKNSTAVGCAKVHCTKNSPFGSSFPEWDFSVCDYNPAGNYVGQRPY
jgi:hypothetical protein